MDDKKQLWQALGKMWLTDGYCLVGTESASSIFNILFQLAMNIWIQYIGIWISVFVWNFGNLPPLGSQEFLTIINMTESGFAWSSGTWKTSSYFFLILSSTENHVFFCCFCNLRFSYHKTEVKVKHSLDTGIR